MTSLAPEEKRMEAGRRLDAEIAEKIFGLPNVRQSQSDPDRWFYGGGLPENIPAYSTDISAAWTVVEKMLADHVGDFVLRVSWVASTAPAQSGIPGWSAFFDDAIGTEETLAPTAPLAICLAALRAVSGESPL